MAKVYVTRYALTKGILVCEQLGLSESGNMVTVRWRGGLNGEAHFHGADWHESLELAQARAKAMVESKLKGLAKQVIKMERLLASGVPVKS